MQQKRWKRGNAKEQPEGQDDPPCARRGQNAAAPRRMLLEPLAHAADARNFAALHAVPPVRAHSDWVRGGERIHRLRRDRRRRIGVHWRGRERRQPWCHDGCGHFGRKRRVGDRHRRRATLRCLGRRRGHRLARHSGLSYHRKHRARRFHPALAQIGTLSSTPLPTPFALFFFAAVCKLDCSLKAGNCHSLVGQVRRSRGLERSARGVQGAEGRRGDTTVALAALCRAAEGTRSSRCLWSSKAARGPPRLPRVSGTTAAQVSRGHAAPCDSPVETVR